MTYYFQKPKRPVTRVFLHCSASDRPEHDSVAVINAWHKEKGWAGIGYHFFIRKDGTLEKGRDLEKTPAAQAGNNTATIAICLHGLDRDAFTQAQFDTLKRLCAQINQAYDGRVTFHGHCEVAAKTCPVFVYQSVLGIDTKGKMPLLTGLAPAISTPRVEYGELEVLPVKGQVLQLGMKGTDVGALQTLLTQLGYHVGEIDEHFGKRTRASVMAFQADNHLEADGKVGNLTREALAQWKPREVAPERAAMSLVGLATKGSRIAQSSVINGAIGAALTGGGLVTILDQVMGASTAVSAHADQVQALFTEHGLISGSIILAAGVAVAVLSWRAGQARVQDHRTGKTA